MKISKLTSKGRVTIPHALRRAAHFKAGDKLAFELDGDRLIVTKLKPSTAKNAYWGGVSSNFEEWLSDEDEEAWHSL